MKHIQLFEQYNTGIPAKNLSDPSWWAQFDDEEAADSFAKDLGYQALDDALGKPLSAIKCLNSETDNVDEIENTIDGLTPENSMKSNQEFVRGWEYYPSVGVAVAYGDAGAPDWYFY